MSNIIQNGASTTVNLQTGEKLAVSAIDGTFSAVIRAGVGVGTALATNSLGGEYGPYASPVVIQISSSSNGLVDFEVGTVPTLDYREAVTAVTNPLTGGIKFNLQAVKSCDYVIVGDSRAEAGKLGDGSQSGYIDVIAAKLGGRLQFRGNFAAGGKVLGQVLSEQMPQVRSLGRQPAIVFMEAGFNDASQGRSLVQMQVDWVAIYQSLCAYGILLVQSTSLPGNALIGNATATATLRMYNEWLVGMATKADGFVCFDGASVVLDTSTGGMLAARTTDGSHCDFNGAWAIAELGTPLVDSITPKCSPVSSDNDAYSLINGNPMGAGSGGTKTANITASVVPYGWEIKHANSGAATVSIVARQYPMLGNVVRVDMTAGSTVNDYVTLEADRVNMLPWSSGLSVAKNDRVKPTSGNGYQYMAAADGSLATQADPTATWPTSVGATFVCGSVTLVVVDEINAGDQIVITGYVDAADFGGLPGTLGITYSFYSQAGFISGGESFKVTASSPVPTIVPQKNIAIRSMPLTLPAGTKFVTGALKVIGRSSARVDVSRIEIRKHMT